MSLQLNPDIYRAVLESLPIGVYVTDLKGRIAFWNAGAGRIAGYLGQEMIGHFSHENLLMQCDENQLALSGSLAPLMQTILDGRARESNIFLRHKEGQRIPVRVNSVPVRDEFGTVIGAAEFFEDRALLGADSRYPHLQVGVSVDDVSQIPDRQSMHAGLLLSVKDFAVSLLPFGVLSIAIDKLDELCHDHGRKAADAIIYAVAQTLLAGLRPEDMVGRWSPERFTALLVCPDAEGLRSCAERLRRLVSLAAVPWWGDLLSVTVSMGGAIARQGDTVESLVERAEGALTAAMAIRPDSVLLA